MTNPTRDALRANAQATPKMIAAAWAAWHARHGGKLGPGPAFVEAINAALSVEQAPQPVAHDDWFSQIVSFLVKNGMLDQREEYYISDVLAALGDNYEPRSAQDGDAIDAIQRLMETKSLARKDIFPAKSRASEYLSRKRPLPITTIRKLHFEHGIPAEVLISPYRLTAGETP